MFAPFSFVQAHFDQADNSTPVTLWYSYKYSTPGSGSGSGVGVGVGVGVGSGFGVGVGVGLTTTLSSGLAPLIFTVVSFLAHTSDSQ